MGRTIILLRTWVLAVSQIIVVGPKSRVESHHLNCMRGMNLILFYQPMSPSLTLLTNSEAKSKVNQLKIARQQQI